MEAYLLNNYKNLFKIGKISGMSVDIWLYTT